jgi:UDP-N-acetyl-D-galactosamine dehydrogenase
VADAEEARREYGVELSSWESLPKAAAIVAAVAHQAFRERPVSDYMEKLQPGGVLVDVKSLFDASQLEKLGITVWRL